MKDNQNKTASILLPHIVSSTAIVWAHTTEEYRMADYERDRLIRAQSTNQVYQYDGTGMLTEAPIRHKDGTTSGGRKFTFEPPNPRKAIEWFSKPRPADQKKPAKLPELGSADDYAEDGSVLIMFDVAAQLQHPPGSKHSNPLLTRVLKNNTTKLTDSNKMIVLVSHTMDIPQELEHTAVLVEHQLPDAIELETLVHQACNYFMDETDNKAQILNPSQDEVDLVAGQLTGMRLLEADNILARSVYANKVKRVKDPNEPVRFDIPTIREERVKAVRKNSALQIITPIGGLEQVGGHVPLKDYFKKRRRMFTREARDEGLSSPKGVLLCGFSGTGKTYLASAIAHEWGATLLRGDVGACKAGLVGASENNFRKMLLDAENQAGENSPVVLLLDEAGKMFGGGLKGGQALDSGVTTGLSAIYLTWRQGCKKPVYVIMSANEDAQNFPMEWLRPGRLDKIFFVDLPNLSDRQEVFHIHLARRNWSEEGLDLEVLGRAADGFTPAEIELAVEDGILLKWEEKGPRPAKLEMEHLERAISGVNPMSKSNKAEMDELREWAATRGYAATRPAEEPTTVKPRPAGRRVGGKLAAAEAAAP